jgi:hypothetical protein
MSYVFNVEEITSKIHFKEQLINIVDTMKWNPSKFFLMLRKYVPNHIKSNPSPSSTKHQNSSH